mgnify:CR=1 FL=1
MLRGAGPEVMRELMQELVPSDDGDGDVAGLSQRPLALEDMLTKSQFEGMDYQRLWTQILEPLDVKPAWCDTRRRGRRRRKKERRNEEERIRRRRRRRRRKQDEEQGLGRTKRTHGYGESK